MTKMTLAILLAAGLSAGLGAARAASDADGRSTTKPDQFLGRWTLTSAYHANKESTGTLVLDVARCGADFCGITVSGNGGCEAKILTFKDHGFDKRGEEGNDRYTGTLAWHDAVATYYVSVDISEADPSDKTGDQLAHLDINGYPASNGVPSTYDARVYPISIDFKYAGAAKCGLPSS